jgi:PUA domain protein
LPALSQDVQEVCRNVFTSAISNIDLKGRFQPTTDISGQTTVKSSIQRGIRSAILSSWKIDVETLEEIWPKKESIVHVKWCVASILFRVGKGEVIRVRVSCVSADRTNEMNCSRDNLSIYTLHGEPLFFQHFDGPYFPTLRLLHKCKCIQFYYGAALTS